MIEENNNSSPFLPAGRQLKTAREARGLSIDDVAGQLKLSRRQVEALEQEAFDELPSNLFIRGFVRNYSRLLNIDAQPLLEYLAGVLPEDKVVESAAAVNVQINQSFPDMRSPSKTANSSVFMIVALMGVFIGVAAVYWYLQQPSAPEVALPEASSPAVVPAPEEIASAASEASAVASAVPALSASVAASLPEPVASKPSAVVASAVAGAQQIAVVTESDSWVQIVDSTGTKVLSEIIRPGYEKTVSGVAPFSVKIGNAPKTKISLQGRAVDLSPYLKPGSDVVNLELK